MRGLVIFIIGGIMGVVAGGGLMLLLFPYLFPPPMVNETIDSSAGLRVIHETSFRENAPGQDAAHWGRGDVKVYQASDGAHMIEFQANFEVGAGPNFWIYLNTQNNIDEEADFKADENRVRLTKIKSFQGSQVYEIAPGQWQGTQALTIWCESFGVYIASANFV